jgi:hypothetical protein
VAATFDVSAKSANAPFAAGPANPDLACAVSYTQQWKVGDRVVRDKRGVFRRGMRDRLHRSDCSFLILLTSSCGNRFRLKFAFATLAPVSMQ